MEIRRIEVDEGFLTGLDLTLSNKLNVVIGPRGSGKTSIIELIRYCLDVEATAEEQIGKSAREHALSVLQAGEVTVTLRLADKTVKVSRTAEDELPRSTDSFPKPQIYSQNEIEAVGLDPGGRLGIVDGFIENGLAWKREERAITSKIRSLTTEIEELSSSLEQVGDKIRELETAPEELAAAKAAQEDMAESLEEFKEEREELEKHSDEIAEISLKQDILDRAESEIATWVENIAQLLVLPPQIPEWPENTSEENLLADLSESVESASEEIRSTLEGLRDRIDRVREFRSELTETRVRLDKRSRQLRGELEELQEGSGEAARRVSALKEKVGQLEAYKGRRDDLTEKISQTRDRRAEALTALDELRQIKFRERDKVANEINEKLGPDIRVKVIRGGYRPKYVSAIRSGLRGSGLHYNVLAPEMAEKVSPRELAQLVESGAADKLADLVGIGEDRAQRVASEIAKTGTADILTASIEDSIEMSLLDGKDYKPTTELSTGQRCTVILSILLGYEDIPLIIDQPEDHLDNAFIVDTLIESIVKSKYNSQLIFATHNANIPVLGEAEKVVALGSDGTHGFVANSGGLDDIGTVRAITSIMEGGREAFQRRAQFYNERLQDTEAG